MLLFWAIYLPLYVSVIMRVFGWMVITADSGMINTALLALRIVDQPVRMLYEVEGMTLGILHRYLPLMIVPLVAALQKLDDELLKASANLGAGRWYTWRRVVLPMSLPGVVAGIQLVFAGVLSDYVLPSLMGTTRFPMVAPAIFYEAATNGSWATAGAMGTLVLAAVALFLFCANRAPKAGRAMGEHAIAMRAAAATPSLPARCYAALVVLFLIGPILIGVVVAFSSGDRLEFPPPGLSLRWFREALRTPQFMEGLWNSVIIAAGSAALATLAGTGAAIALNHYRFFGRSAVQALVMLPITLPGIVLGLGLLFMLQPLRA